MGRPQPKGVNYCLQREFCFLGLLPIPGYLPNYLIYYHPCDLPILYFADWVNTIEPLNDGQTLVFHL
jgi:hypothetical protein